VRPRLPRRRGAGDGGGRPGVAVARHRREPSPADMAEGLPRRGIAAAAARDLTGASLGGALDLAAEVELAGDDGFGHVAEPQVVVAGVATNRMERRLRVGAGARGHVALGLLDRDPRGEGRLQLVVEQPQLPLEPTPLADVVAGEDVAVAGS